jgi:hypothetical protein
MKKNFFIRPSIEPMSKKSNQFSTLIDDFSNASVMKHSTAASKKDN